MEIKIKLANAIFKKDLTGINTWEKMKTMTEKIKIPIIPTVKVAIAPPSIPYFSTHK